MNVKVYVNPDGHEWKRSKWNAPIRKYWKKSEGLMVKYADLLVCDSKGIETYIKQDYKRYNPKTLFIAYGADVTRSAIKDDNIKLREWYKLHKIKSNNYYLIVGRFVPENNYELMIKEFMLSSSDKALVIISNIELNSFYEDLRKQTSFEKDPRIKFVGTIYDQDLLKKVREQAYGYLHGHEVGGTNPSLLEALASTRLNLLLDVVFNREVGEEGALYFTKKSGNLSKVINNTDTYSEELIEVMSKNARNRIINEYSWEKIIGQYEDLFLNSNR